MVLPTGSQALAGTAELTDAVRRLARTSVMVVGDAMLDRYVYGAVKRVSPEAPIPILSVERDVAMPGGAGNVVRNLTALGAAVAFVSVVGDDQSGSDLTGLIGGQPNVEPWLLVQGGRTTTTKTRYVAQGQQLLRADHEIAARDPTQAGRAPGPHHAGRAYWRPAVTVLSDYGKGVLSGDVRGPHHRRRPRGQAPGRGRPEGCATTAATPAPTSSPPTAASWPTPPACRWIPRPR